MTTLPKYIHSFSSLRTSLSQQNHLVSCYTNSSTNQVTATLYIQNGNGVLKEVLRESIKLLLDFIYRMVGEF